MKRTFTISKEPAGLKFADIKQGEFFTNGNETHLYMKTDRGAVLVAADSRVGETLPLSCWASCQADYTLVDIDLKGRVK